MQILLIARCQFICICFLFMLLIYTLFNKRINTRSDFTKICVTALLQVTLDFITIILVNIPRNNTTMKLINRIAHILVVYFAVLFCYYFMCYIARMIFSPQITKKVSAIGSIPIMAYLFLSPFIDFDYIEGRGTNYVGGMYVDLWFFV